MLALPTTSRLHLIKKKKTKSVKQTSSSNNNNNNNNKKQPRRRRRRRRRRRQRRQEQEEKNQDQYVVQVPSTLQSTHNAQVRMYRIRRMTMPVYTVCISIQIYTLSYIHIIKILSDKYEGDGRHGILTRPLQPHVAAALSVLWTY